MIHYSSGNMFVKYLIEGHTPDGCGLTDILAEDIKEHVNNEYDSVVTITGGVGTGKSNFGVDLAKTCDPTFTLEDRYVYDLAPFLEKLAAEWDTLKPGMCYLMDEATNLANNRDWNNSVNKYFVEFLEMFRSLGLILILIIPTRKRLDVYLREGNRTRYFIEAHDLKNGGKYKGRGFYELTIVDEYAGEKFVAMGTFPKMDLSYFEKYAKLKKESQKAKLDEMINALRPKDKPEGRNKDREMAMYFLFKEGWTSTEVSKQFGIPASTIRNWKQDFVAKSREE